MLDCYKGKSRTITNVERQDDCLYLTSEYGKLRIMPKEQDILRITYTLREDFSTKEKPGVTHNKTLADWTFEDLSHQVVLKTEQLSLTIDKETLTFVFQDKTGKLLHTCGGREIAFEEFTTYRLADVEQKTQKIQTADGEKQVIMDAVKEVAGSSYRIKLPFQFGDEDLYGLGQHEEGYATLRGQKVYVHQANRKIAIPFFLSSKGYGVLFDCYSPSIFNDTLEGSYYMIEAASELDFYFLGGTTPKEALKGYRKLTGKAALLPKWAFGYVQSQERYETAEELLAITKETRDRGFGMDLIVLDWCSWPDGMWGQKSFDAERFPNPEQMIADLDVQNTHLMVSIWPNMDEKTANYQEFQKAGLLVPAGNVYNAYIQAGRELYWKQVKEGLYGHGIKAFWCDSSEPYTPEWTHPTRPDASRAYMEFQNEMALHADPEMTNCYGLFHAQTINDGQRSEKDNQRIVNLTRSAYIGQQRYGTILWSGDIEATWDTYRKQIAAGLQFCASGFPYWTVDVGAFFVKQGETWFWHGDYDEGPADLGYRELFTRMFQWACFLPVFRVHGTDFRREMWQFGEKGTMFYDTLLKFNQLRYSLLPYIYSEAGKTYANDETLMRLLAIDYPNDDNCRQIIDQYLFGESMMICPVTKPMYYTAGSKDISDTTEKTRKVYLPEGNRWFDYWTNQVYEGGQWIVANADITTIPIYVKEGSIIPHTTPALSTKELSGEIEYRSYGDEAVYTMYTDDEDGFAYENGAYKLQEYKNK